MAADNNFGMQETADVLTDKEIKDIFGLMKTIGKNIDESTLNNEWYDKLPNSIKGELDQCIITLIDMFVSSILNHDYVTIPKHNPVPGFAMSVIKAYEAQHGKLDVQKEDQYVVTVSKRVQVNEIYIFRFSVRDMTLQDFICNNIPHIKFKEHTNLQVFEWIGGNIKNNKVNLIINDSPESITDLIQRQFPLSRIVSFYF